jgi:predicted amino acid-binding ACT domain protein
MFVFTLHSSFSMCVLCVCRQTEKAASRIKDMLAAKDAALGVKVGVKRRKKCNCYIL